MSLNRVILMGTLVRDPEIKQLPSGTSLCSFCIAVNEKYKKADGTMQEDTSFIDVSMFGKRGETIQKYFTKGKPIIVEGKLKQEKWVTKEGDNRSKLSVLADNFEFLPNNGASKSDGSQRYDVKKEANDDLPF